MPPRRTAFLSRVSWVRSPHGLPPRCTRDTGGYRRARATAQRCLVGPDAGFLRQTGPLFRYCEADRIALTLGVRDDDVVGAGGQHLVEATSGRAERDGSIQGKDKPGPVGGRNIGCGGLVLFGAVHGPTEVDRVSVRREPSTADRDAGAERALPRSDA